MNDMYNRIANLCKERGVNVTEMCRRTNIPRGNLTDLKMGRTAALSTKTLSKISVFFEVPMDYLLGNDDAKKPTGQVADGLEKTGYEQLTPENRKMIDSLIDSLLKSQSGE